MRLTKEGIAIVEWDTLLSRQVEEAGRLDVARDLIYSLKQYIPEGGVVVDVGACIGDHTVTYSELVGIMGCVYAFEPNPEAFTCLEHNAGRLRNVSLVPMALGNSPSKASLTTSDTNLGATRLTGNTGSVDVMRLDGYPFTRLDFMKIDIEGYEPLMLDGAVKTIMKFRPVMLIEVNDEMLGHQGFIREHIYHRLENMHYRFHPSPENSYDLLCLPA